MNKPERRLGIAYHDSFLAHDAGPEHPERPERVIAIMEAIYKASWRYSIDLIEPKEATSEQVQLLHDRRYVRAMQRLCDAGGAYLVSMEATVCEDSYAAAVRSIGAGIELTDAIMEGRWQIGFAPTRPPGHHATVDRPRGFSIFNTIAVTAKHLLANHGLDRIAIFDFDVHHGNGTESAFWNDPRVFYCSIHRDGFFPFDRGRVLDRGSGKGEGYTLNIPLKQGAGDQAYIEAIEKTALPAIHKFDPQFLLVSAGFDAHVRDMVGGMKVTSSGYKEIAGLVLKMAAGNAGGRIISVLEGGYDLDSLADAVTTYLGRLIEG